MWDFSPNTPLMKNCRWHMLYVENTLSVFNCPVVSLQRCSPVEVVRMSRLRSRQPVQVVACHEESKSWAMTGWGMKREVQEGKVRGSEDEKVQSWSLDLGLNTVTSYGHTAKEEGNSPPSMTGSSFQIPNTAWSPLQGISPSSVPHSRLFSVSRGET